MEVDVISPLGSICKQEADSVIAPAIDGQIGILENHASMLTALGQGELVLSSKGQTEKYTVQGGFLQVEDNQISILVESAEKSQN